MDRIELYGRVDAHGKISLYQRDLLNKWALSKSDNQIVLSVVIKSKRRSNNQNAYYWGVIISMVKDAMNGYGNDFDAQEFASSVLGIYIPDPNEALEIDFKD